MSGEFDGSKRDYVWPKIDVFTVEKLRKMQEELIYKSFIIPVQTHPMFWSLWGPEYHFAANLEITLKRVAVHESGHAVACTAIGVPALELYAQVNPPKGYVRFCTYPMLTDLQWVVVSAAGAAAETILLGSAHAESSNGDSYNMACHNPQTDWIRAAFEIVKLNADVVRRCAEVAARVGQLGMQELDELLADVQKAF